MSLDFREMDGLNKSGHLCTRQHVYQSPQEHLQGPSWNDSLILASLFSFSETEGLFPKQEPLSLGRARPR